MYELISEYLKYPPYEVLPILELRIPCSTQCLSNSRYKQLLEIEAFKSQLEVIDSLKDLIKYKIENLIDEVSVRISNRENVDISLLTYSVYKIIEFGGDYQIGYDNIVFENKKIFAGSFNEIMRLNKEIEKILTDKDVRSLCDEIRYLSESTWEHFDKNIRRSLNESQSRT
ncbi:hypothetical protein EWF20_04085 [Sulfolobus sp. S-194]|uniref:hypothetical protein n=1 Tax=Sulfolobus sp. S-194 TaxID=2512240 RepID=UPI001436E6DC|nr:hypothetical protein [Sulfolobus sp. S-194]QIW23408.1 hypothetical protein EWF20_04085 [Sulfolobus sp. S-194]